MISLFELAKSALSAAARNAGGSGQHPVNAGARTATTTKTGLKVECALDERAYEKGIKITDAEMEAFDIRGDTFHPEWNYTVPPASEKL